MAASEPFDPAVLAADPARRIPLLEVLAAALAAIDPEAPVRRAIAGIDTTACERVVVVGLGKAALGMAAGAAAALPGLPMTGVLAAPATGPAAGGIEVIAAGHPLPDAGSVAAATRARELLRRAGSTDLVLALISGGGSALFELPVPGVALDDVAAVTNRLLLAGAPIEEVNAVRKHLSLVKGGGLAGALGAGRLVTLVVSDVVGNPLDSIASGPTVPDPTTFADALGVLERHGVPAPDAVLAHLERGAAGDEAETLKQLPAGVDHSIAVVADGATAASAARQAAARRGLAGEIVTLGLAGEARSVARALVTRARASPAPGLWIHAGETTVTVGGDGNGGRNQELALAAAIAADGDPSLVVAALATDGVDGPTAAAGAVVDGCTVARGRAAGLVATDHLDRNDANPYLAATGDLLRTGPTGTNVGDLVIVWRTDSVAQ